jgi:hypothetical protein
MDTTFVGEKEKFIVIYLDDMTVLSKPDEDNMKHLRQNFIKCRRFGLSLNPKKYLLSIKEGKLLGHIVSKEGVGIEPNRVKSIRSIGIAKNKKRSVVPFRKY